MAISVSEIKRLALQKKDKKISIYNPLLEDFTVLYGGVPQIVKAGKIKEFPYHCGMHIAKHLVNRLMNDKDLRTDHEPERSKILKEVIYEENDGEKRNN